MAHLLVDLVDLGIEIFQSERSGLLAESGDPRLDSSELLRRGLSLLLDLLLALAISCLNLIPAGAEFQTGLGEDRAIQREHFRNQLKGLHFTAQHKVGGASDLVVLEILVDEALHIFLELVADHLDQLFAFREDMTAEIGEAT